MTDQREACVLLGVCSMPAIAWFLNQSPDFRRRFRTKVVFTNNGGIPITTGDLTDEDFATCRLVIHHGPQWAGWTTGPAFEAVLARFAHAPCISLPIPLFPALWPLHVFDERNTWGADVPGRPLWPNGMRTYYPYGDAFVLGLLRMGVSKRDIIARYLELDIPSILDVDRIFNLNAQTMIAHERTTDVKVAAFVSERFRDQWLFQTLNHQSNALLIEIVNQTLALLGFPPLHASIHEEWAEMLSIQMPIHPSLIRHFGLTFVDASTRYTIDGQLLHSETGSNAEMAQEMGKRRLTFEQFLERYIDFTVGPAPDDELAVWRDVSARLFAARAAGNLANTARAHS